MKQTNKKNRKTPVRNDTTVQVLIASAFLMVVFILSWVALTRILN